MHLAAAPDEVRPDGEASSAQLEGAAEGPQGPVPRGELSLIRDEVVAPRPDTRLPGLDHVANASGRASRAGALRPQRLPRRQWQRKNSCTVPSGRWSECSTECWETFEPSEPVSLRLKVNVLFVSAPLALKPPQTASWPV